MKMKDVVELLLKKIIEIAKYRIYCNYIVITAI